MRIVHTIAAVMLMLFGLGAVAALAQEQPAELVLGEAGQRRVALVLGNSAYQNVPALANPVEDAKALQKTLEALKFEVIPGFDLTMAQTQETVARFAKSVRGAHIALFFYAGHGMQVGGNNYLLPVDAKLEDETSIDFQAVPIDFILRQMSRDTGIRLVFLDACRDNPMAKVLAESGESGRVSTASSGLAEVQLENSGAGTLVAFATSPNEVAYDGKGEHSPFSAALIAHLGEANMPLTTIMTEVTGDVFKATSGLQRPWLNVSLTDQLFLNKVETPPETPAVVAAAPPSDAGTASRTAGSGVNNPADDEAQIALNLLRKQIPKIETEGPIAFDTPINFGEADIDGKSISQLIQGKPLYSPVEGLEKSVWDTHCSSCHAWTRERLCEQSGNYDRVDVSIMRLQHPYGSRFKVALANWAKNGCK